MDPTHRSSCFSSLSAAPIENTNISACVRKLYSFMLVELQETWTNRKPLHYCSTYTDCSFDLDNMHHTHFLGNQFYCPVDVLRTYFPTDRPCGIELMMMMMMLLDSKKKKPYKYAFCDFVRRCRESFPCFALPSSSHLLPLLHIRSSHILSNANSFPLLLLYVTYIYEKHLVVFIHLVNAG